MTDVTNGYVKALFFSLVKTVGGVEAAGAYLNISHQRVSQLQSQQCADMPTVMHIVTLEQACGQDLVTGVLSRHVTGEAARGDLITEACEAVEAGANVLQLVRTKASPQAIRMAVTNLHKQASDVVDAAARDHGREAG